MNEELKALLESSVLSDDVKSELTEAFQSQVQKAVSAKEVELAEQFEQKKAELAKETVEMIEEAVTEEMKAVQDELVEARSLDIRYAIKMEEFKEQYATAKSAELEEMVQEEIKKEMDEMRESLEEARKNIVGKRMFEAFESAFHDMVSEGDAGKVQEELKEAKEELSKLRREKKLNELLEGVTGRKLNVMKSLLENVADDKLEDRFTELSESVLLNDKGDDKDESLDEGAKDDKDDIDENSKVVIESAADDEDDKAATAAWLKNARRRAGLE